MKKVINSYGIEVDFDAAVAIMDDELREEIHTQFAPCSEQKFFDEYVKAHEARFLGEFPADSRDPML